MILPISLVVITKNEELNLERCLQSAHGLVGEMWVIDSQSQDRTIEIAKKNGAKIADQPWLGFGPQKAWGARQARYDWILSLDADEALSPELVSEIREKFATLDSRVGYLIPRKSKHLGREILHGGWYPDRQLRLFHRQHSMWNQAKIHEKVESPEVQSLKSPILHNVFQNLHHQIETNNRYSTLQADELFQKGRPFRWHLLLIKPVSKFAECYIWKRGFLDGVPGFMIAVGAAYSVFLKWSKLWELEMKQSRGSKS